MTTPLSRLTSAFRPNPDGVVGMVDGVLDVGRGHEFSMTFDDEAHAVSVRVGNEAVRVPVRKSVFRAALARVAALCDAPGRDIGSPYEGGGEIAFATPSPAAVRVAFKNTPDSQHLSVSPVAAAESGGGGDSNRVSDAVYFMLETAMAQAEAEELSRAGLVELFKRARELTVGVGIDIDLTPFQRRMARLGQRGKPAFPQYNRPQPAPPADSAEAKLEALEKRVAALEAARPTGGG